MQITKVIAHIAMRGIPIPIPKPTCGCDGELNIYSVQTTRALF